MESSPRNNSCDDPLFQATALLAGLRDRAVPGAVLDATTVYGHLAPLAAVDAAFDAAIAGGLVPLKVECYHSNTPR